ncbi:hypothetical protein JCM11251_005373 [Rhodosporidiobolus azoricus]
MSIRRILPLEVQSLILSYLVAPRASAAVPLLARHRGSSSRFSSTASFPSRDLFPSSSCAGPAAHDASTVSDNGATTLSVFEDRTDEYDHVPLSTLDHPPAPRSPADLLLNLLFAGEHAEALELLHDLQASGQAIETRSHFARFAKIALVSRGDPAWLEWWKLAPSRVGKVDTNSLDVRKDSVLVRQYARRIAENLLKKGTKTGVDWPLFADFGCLLAQQGHVRVVADTVFPELAAYGPVELGERVFRTALDELQRQRSQFVVPSNLGHRSVRYKARRRRAGLPIPPALALARSRAIALRAYVQSETRDSFEALLAARRQAILSLANLGQLDTAVHLVFETQSLPSLDPNKPIRLGRVLLIRLLSLCAVRNRFDLFQSLYDSLQVSGRRLVRIRNSHLRVRTPFIIRGTEFDPLGSNSPTARDAFTAYRYRQVVSPIEEGPTEAELGQVPEEAFAFGTPPGRARVTQLLKHLKDGYTENAIRDMFKFLVNMSFPSASVTAAWISYFKALNNGSDQALATALADFDALVNSNMQRRGYWTTATMLSHLQAGQPEAAILSYKSHYALAALPDAVRDAINSVIKGTPRAMRETAGQAGREREKRFPPSAYTFSILVQALVASLQRLALAMPASTSTAESSGMRYSARIDAVYDSLVSTPTRELNILPVVHNVDTSASGETSAWINHDSSPLSPYTFTPFLLHHTRQRSPPLALLNIMADMTRLGLQPQLPHYSLILNAFARHGDPPSLSPSPSSPSASSSSNDLFFLLDCFSRRTTDSLLASQASPAVVELITSGSVALPPAGPAGDFNAIVYTGVLSGLLKRKEKDLALKVLNEVLEERGKEVQQWGKEDEKFREVVIQVVNRDRREEQV